jgi:protein disulfide-isomerase
MKNQILIIVLSLLLSSTVISQETGSSLVWETNLEKALELSKKSGKPILANFTGSDWCGWCKKLKANAFDKPEFKEWADENVVLLEVDFPRRKQLPQELKDQNYALQNAFGVRGYPTIHIFTGEINKSTGQFTINKYGKTGYPRAEQSEVCSMFIKECERIIKNGPSTAE